MRIEPTVARMVLYYPQPGDTLFSPADATPLAAVVARVNDNGTLNLCVFDRRGHNHARQDVRLLQEGDSIIAGESYAAWMAYQKGQAAKTDTLEPRLVAAEDLLVKVDSRVGVLEGRNLFAGTAAVVSGQNNTAPEGAGAAGSLPLEQAG